MREIKFRVWLDGLKNMCEVKSIHFDSGIVYVKHEEHHNGYDKSRSEVYDIVGCHAVPVMQYTGLKDNNGKEIYEGDIFAYIFDGGMYIGEVVFKDAAFIVEWKKDKWLSDKLAAHVGTAVVVGNIYENKELLND